MALDSLSAAPGEFSRLRLVSGEINFNVASPFTVELDEGELAAGEFVIHAWADVEVAFNAATTNVLTLGDGTTADKYLAAGDVTEGTPGASAAKGPFAQESAARVLTAKYTQTGTAATTGRARLFALIGGVPA